MSELPKRVTESIDGFTGRTWLLPKLLAWWERTDEQLLLLTGGPGTGKSMILAWLAGFGPEPRDALGREQLSRLRVMVKAFHFFQASSRNITPRAFAQSIANQLTSKVKGFGDALADTLAERLQIIGTVQAGTAATGSKLTGVAITQIDLSALGDELSFDRAFTEPLKKLYENGHSEPMLLLVDALDEADTYTGIKKIPHLLSCLSDLPALVRILATTRDEPRVLKFFRGITALDLIQDADPDVDDVHTYAAGRLAEFATMDEAKRQGFAQRLTKQAGGVFLYAAMVLDELLDRPPSGLPDLNSYPLPNGLSGLYHAFLTRELGKDEKSWFELYEPLLGLIAVAQGEGLTAQQLKAIIRKDIHDTLRACKQYLTGALREGPFRVFHTSFAEFLLEDKQNVHFHIDATTMHNRVADHYWSHKLDWTKCDDDYGLNYLAAHLSSSKRIADLVALIDRPWMQVRYERAGRNYSEFQADLDLAWRAVRDAPLSQLGYLIHIRAAMLAVQEHVKVYEDEDLAILVGLGRSQEALVHARLRNTPERQFQGLLTIYRALVPSQPSATAIELSTKARIAASAIGDALERVRALCSLARALSRTQCPGPAEVLDDVRKYINGIRDRRNRAVAERELVSALLEATRSHDAEQIADSIDDDVQRAFALESIAINLADSGRFSEAERLSCSIKTNSILDKPAVQRTYAKTLAGIARALAAVGDTRAAGMFDDAERAATSIEDVQMRDEALEDVTAALTHSSRLSQAQRVAAVIHGWPKSPALLGLVEAFTKMGDFENAKALVGAIPDVRWRSLALRDIARELAGVGRYDEARSIERGFKEITSRASTLRAIAAALFQKGDDRAGDVVREAMSLCEAIRSTSDRAAAFRHLAKILLQAQKVDWAGSVFEQVHQQASVKRDDREYCVALRKMAIALASVKDSHADRLIHEVGNIIKTLQDLWKEGEKRQFATSLSRVGRFHEAWQILESDQNDLQREGAWCELAICLAKVGDYRADEAFEQAQAATQEIVNDEAREEALAKLAEILIEQRRFEKAEGVITLLERPDHHCEALTGLAVALHQDNPTRSHELFALAEQMARQERADYSRDQALVGLVSGLAISGKFDDALRAASTVETDGHRVAALCRLAWRLVLAGDSRGHTLLGEGLRVAISGDPGDTWLEASELRREAAQLTREGDSRAGELWVRAQEVAGSIWAGWMWGESQYRAEGILDLAIALARAQDPRADSTFDLAHRTAIAIPYENARDQTLRKLVSGLIDVGRLENAERVLSDIRQDSERLKAVRDLVRACSAAGQLGSALRLSRSVSSQYYRRELTRDIAAGLARGNRMTDALQVLDEVSLDEFIGTLGIVHAAWAAAPPGAVIASMRAVTSVAAWTRSDWNEVHQALMT